MNAPRTSRELVWPPPQEELDALEVVLLRSPAPTSTLSMADAPSDPAALAPLVEPTHARPLHRFLRIAAIGAAMLVAMMVGVWLGAAHARRSIAAANYAPAPARDSAPAAPERVEAPASSPASSSALPSEPTASASRAPSFAAPPAGAPLAPTSPAPPPNAAVSPNTAAPPTGAPAAVAATASPPPIAASPTAPPASASALAAPPIASASTGAPLTGARSSSAPSTDASSTGATSTGAPSASAPSADAPSNAAASIASPSPVPPPSTPLPEAKPLTDIPGAVGASQPLVSPPARRAEAPSTPVTGPDEAGVKRTLAEYQRAYANLDANAAAVRWPSVDVTALARAFSGLKAQALVFDRCQLMVGTSTAMATCTGTTTVVRQVGSASPITEPLRWTFKLRRAATNDWLIDSVQTTH